MFQRMEYFDVYVLCQAANRLLGGGFERTVNDFFEPFSENYGEQNAFNKFSLLHDYCEWVIRQNVWDEEVDMVQPIRNAYKMREYSRHNGTLWVDQAINHYHNTTYDFLHWIDDESDKTVDQLSDTELEDLRYDYLLYLQEEELFDAFIIQLSNEMFYVLFQNRSFLYGFNQFLATYNQQKKERIPMPQWAQRAIFFRDHGRCVFCAKDLSGTIHITGDREIHYDHIISLANNGINDVSNLQLSCQQCNLKKHKKNVTSTQYQQWYEFDPLK